ncbi:MAG: hypothetical protein KGH75_00350 [Rhodospirillales bacterium]|nr:hypothetical protein [Rhodospirillales bacterium]
MGAMTEVNHEGPVSLFSRPNTQMVEGHCTEEGCEQHTFVGFGIDAARTMARRHIVLNHPDIKLDATDNGTGAGQ